MKKRIFSMFIVFCMLFIIYPADAFATNGTITVVMLGNHGTATVADAYSESTSLIWQDELVNGNKVGTDTISHINQGQFNETNLKAGYTINAESGYFIEGFYRCEQDYINHQNGIESENFQPIDPSYTDGFLTTATISELTWPNESFYISFKRIPNPSTVNVILLGNHGTATVASAYSESTGLVWQGALVNGNKVGTDTIKHIKQDQFDETNLKAGYTVIAENGYLIDGFYRSEQDYIDKNNGFNNGHFQLMSPTYTSGALTTAIISELTWPNENFYISFGKISDVVANTIDTAIIAANNAKSGIIIDNNPVSSVAKGTRFVTAAEMSTLTMAIQTATDAKTTATTVEQAQTVASTLNNAVSTFNAVIKTGTYSSGSGGGGGGGATTSSVPETQQGGPIVTPIQSNNQNAPIEAKTDITAKVDTNGTATLAVSDKTISDAIKVAQEAAKKVGAEKNGIAVTINVSTDRTASSIAAALPRASIDSLVNAGVSQVNIQSQTANISLDLATLRQIQSVTGGDAMLKVSKTNIKTLSADAQNAIGNRPVLNLSLTGNGNTISTFGGGSVAISIPYTPQKEENPDNLCAVYIDDEGNVNYLTNSSYDSNTHMLMFDVPHFSIYGIGYKEDKLTFADIKDHWARADIKFVTARGLLNGTGNNLFSPNTSMTRGMFVTALGRLASVDISSYKTSSFADVKEGTYYLPYVEWTVEKNIVKGIGNKAFAPNKTITREEMAVIMANYAKVMGYTVPKKYTQVVFADNSSISIWAVDMVKQIQMAGIMTGKEDNKFDPKATATRAEVSAVMSRYIELVVNTDK